MLKSNECGWKRVDCQGARLKLKVVEKKKTKQKEKWGKNGL